MRAVADLAVMVHRGPYCLPESAMFSFCAVPLLAMTSGGRRELASKDVCI